MFIAFDEVRSQSREWQLDITASTLAEVLSATLAKVPDQPLPEQLTATLRLLDDHRDEHYWRSYY